MQIDPRLLASAAQQAEASLAAAGSQMEQLRVASESAKAALKQAQDAYARQQQLWKQGLTTKETLDTAESQLKMRQSDANSAEKQVETQHLRMAQEQASLESAKYSLSKVRIQSPIDGIVTRRNIEEGETVVVGTMNNAGTVLLTIADMSVIEAQVEVDETDIPTVTIGQLAKVTIDAMPGQELPWQGRRDRQQPDSGGRRRDVRVTGDELPGQGADRDDDRRRASGFHLHRGDHDRDTEELGLACRFRRRRFAKSSSTRTATWSASPRPMTSARGARRASRPRS